MYNNELVALIHAYLYNIALFLAENCGIRDKDGDEMGHYHDLAVEVGWGTFYPNAVWLLYNYNDKRVLFWQVEMTLRLLFETVADTSYALTKSDVKHLKRFFSYLDMDFSKRETIEDYKEAIGDVSFHYNNSLGSKTMERIYDCFKSEGIITYNILSQFQHLNIAGFCSACLESQEPSSFRDGALVTVYYLVREMKRVISLVERYSGLSLVASAIEEMIEDKIERIDKDE